MKRPPLFLMLLLATLADSQMAGAGEETALSESGHGLAAQDHAADDLDTAEALLSSRIKSAA